MSDASKQNIGAKQILNSSNQRVTAQRTLLLELLHQSDRHLDANQLYQQAREKNHRISLSTIYRNLQLFKKLGLVAEHHFSEEHHHYEMRPETEHQHLLCLSCNKVIEFACPVSQRFREDVGKRYDFEITGVEVRMVGLCSTCRQKRATEYR